MKKFLMFLGLFILMTSIVSAGTCYDSLSLSSDGTVFLREQNEEATAVTGQIITTVTNPSGANCTDISEMYLSVKHLQPAPVVDWIDSNNGINVMLWGICADVNDTVVFTYPSQTFEKDFVEVTKIEVIFSENASGTYTFTTEPPTGIIAQFSSEYDKTCSTGGSVGSGGFTKAQNVLEQQKEIQLEEKILSENSIEILNVVKGLTENEKNKLEYLEEKEFVKVDDTIKVEGKETAKLFGFINIKKSVVFDVVDGNLVRQNKFFDFLWKTT